MILKDGDYEFSIENDSISVRGKETFKVFVRKAGESFWSPDFIWISHSSPLLEAIEHMRWFAAFLFKE